MQRFSHEIRRELREAIQRRGRRKYNVWTGYASKGGSRFVLDGTPNTSHLIWMEGDPDVVSYTIPTRRVFGSGNEGPQGAIPDAICVLKSGRIQWREVKTAEEAGALSIRSSDQVITQVSAAETQGADWLLVTTRDLKDQAILINNWRRGLAYLWAAVGVDLEPYCRDLQQLLLNKGPQTVRGIMSSTRADHEALCLAAFFRMAQRGEVISDLDSKAFGYLTSVALR